MDEPRDLAVQWLAEVLDRAGCADSAGFVFAPVSVLAAAILDQPGVEVETLYADDPTGPRIALLLPGVDHAS